MNRKVLTLALLGILISFSVSAEDVVGKITHLNGFVEITRDGDYLDPDDIQIGQKIENFDIISTDEDSIIYIEMLKGDSPGAEIRVNPDTVFSVDLESMGSKKRTSFSLMSGGISLKVQKLAGNMELSVETEAASMGVRGTQFIVQYSPEGGVLIACNEGKVECSSDDGKNLYASPGQVVEQIPGENFRNVAVAVSNLEKFKEDWIAERIEAFKANPLKAIRQYAKKYKKHYQDFNAAYGRLMQNEKIIRRWIKEDKLGKQTGTMQAMKDKKALIKDLMTIRKTLFFFEKTYYRLLELEKYYEKGYGEGIIEPGLTSKQFFIKFKNSTKDLKHKMNVIKHVIKLYAKRNGGSFTLDTFDEAENDNFFKEEDDFFKD